MEQDKESFEPFYNPPNPMGDNSAPTYRHPHYEPPNTFAKAAKVLGIIALVSVFTFTVYPSIVLGTLAIILALLSRGASVKMHHTAKTGVKTAAVAIGLDVTIFVMACLIFFTLLKSETFQTEFKKMSGITFNEMMEEIENGTFDYEEYYENVNEYLYENME